MVIVSPLGCNASLGSILLWICIRGRICPMLCPLSQQLCGSDGLHLGGGFR